MVLVLIAIPVFSQGTIEKLAEKGLIGTYKDLINYEEVESVVLEEETVVSEKETVVLEDSVVFPEEVNESEEVLVAEEISVETPLVEQTSYPEIPTSIPVDGVEAPGYTYLTGLFPQLAAEEMYEINYTYSGFKIGGVFTFDEAVIIIPRGITADSINHFAANLLQKYPEFSSVAFSSEIDKLTLTYPEMTMDEVIAFADTIIKEAEKFIDLMYLRRSKVADEGVSVEEVVENTPVGETVVEDADYNSDLDVNIPLGNDSYGAVTNFDDILLDLKNRKKNVYEVNFSHNGIKTRGIFADNTAVLLIPRGISADSIDRFAGYLLDGYPEFSTVYFKTEVDKLFLYYPEKNMDEIVAFCDLISAQAEKFIDTIYLRRTASENAAITTTTTATSEINEIESVEAPVVVEPKKNIFTYSAGFDLGMKGLFTAGDNEARFFPTIGGGVRLNAWKYLFVEGRGDMFIYKNSSKLVVNGALSALGGASYMFGNFGVSAYGGVCYLFASENSAFTSGFSFVYGAEIEADFVSHIALKLGYEHFDDKHLYKVSIGYRF